MDTHYNTGLGRALRGYPLGKNSAHHPSGLVRLHTRKSQTSGRIRKLDVVGPPAFLRYSENVLAQPIAAQAFDILRIGKALDFLEVLVFQTEKPGAVVLRDEEVVGIGGVQLMPPKTGNCPCLLYTSRCV